MCGNHWIAISTVGCKPSSIKIYDSLLAGGVSRHTQKLIADLMQCKSKAITIEYVDVQEQKGSNDCGLFAIAFVTSICNGVDPVSQLYDQKQMRGHLLECIECEVMKPFPVNGTRKPGPAHSEQFKVYCICRLPHDNTKMIKCSKCGEWFHLECVMVPAKYIRQRALDWFCAKCT